jgi:transcription initiation factor TFIIIB Brf1 subunit/transcription initiation factor TFIIB
MDFPNYTPTQQALLSDILAARRAYTPEQEAELADRCQRGTFRKKARRLAAHLRSAATRQSPEQMVRRVAAELGLPLHIAQAWLAELMRTGEVPQ